MCFRSKRGVEATSPQPARGSGDTLVGHAIPIRIDVVAAKLRGRVVNQEFEFAGLPGVQTAPTQEG